jgi:hypothetical protein
LAWLLNLIKVLATRIPFNLEKLFESAEALLLRQ